LDFILFYARLLLEKYLFIWEKEDFYRESLRRALQWNVREEAIFAEKNSGFCVFIGFTFIQFV